MTNLSLTPMMQQYYQAKSEAGDAILFFRLGDFYEMFADDADVASGILDIALTSREAGPSGRVSMCGIPYHSAEGYIGKLLDAGHRVAICEQVQDPREAKGLVKREIVRYISPGTVMEPSMLDDRQANRLVAIVSDSRTWGLAAVDITTGRFVTTEVYGEDAINSVLGELVRLKPAELLVSSVPGSTLTLIDKFKTYIATAVTRYAPEAFSPQAAEKMLLSHFGSISLASYGCEGRDMATAAAGAIIRYVRETQADAPALITSLSFYAIESYLQIDASSRRNLELVQTMRDGSRKGSLIWVLDKTQTAVGGRLLRDWLEQPLVSPLEIHSRLSAVEVLHADASLRDDLCLLLQRFSDVERLMGRLSVGTANARDLAAIGHSIGLYSRMRDIVLSTGQAVLVRLVSEVQPLDDIHVEIERTLDEDLPFSIREGGIIRAGVSHEIDELRAVKAGAKEWIEQFELAERHRTGIKSLKVSFNQVFGYYIEITRANFGSIPPEYVRRQTLANAERFITAELKEYEERILGAKDKICDLEHSLFLELRAAVLARFSEIRAIAATVAQLDVFMSLAEVAVRRHYVKPTVDAGDAIKIVDGRHPVVEAISEEGFVANSCELTSDDRIAIITGPNMAGKSTYIRQVALICLMAQMGSFVPANYACIGVVDRIFTRVGASDDLATGRSTFMVELTEIANILNHASTSSLIILDEIGRGTSTFDGLAIAWAVTEYIHDRGRIGAKTLFATHYHELTELEKILAGVQNFSVAIKQSGNDIAFLRKIVKGSAGKSYGIEVARLAGLPVEVVERANEILQNLEQADDLEKKQRKRDTVASGWQLGLFVQGSGGPSLEAFARELAGLSVEAMTPVEALVKLSDLSSRASRAIAQAQGGVAIGQGALT